MSYYYTSSIKREIGKNIKKAREKRGLNQVDIAVDAGVNPSYYSKIERGEVNPSMEIFYRIKALKVKSSEILPF